MKKRMIALLLFVIIGVVISIIGIYMGADTNGILKLIWEDAIRFFPRF